MTASYCYLQKAANDLYFLISINGRSYSSMKFIKMGEMLWFFKTKLPCNFADGQF